MDELAMIKRRQFLGCLTAFGGSYLLTACGGGSSDGIGNADGAVANSATNNAAVGNAVVNAATTASADGTSLPSSAKIVDNSGNVWTLSGGVVYRNGAVAGVNYNVALALWYAGTVYHQNTGGQFYSWNGSGWTACLDPRTAGISPDGATIPSGTVLIDKQGRKWTVNAGVIYRDGAVVGVNYNVALLLWYGGMMWHKNTSGQFYVWANAGGWLASTDPRISGSAAAGSFFGVNGHWDYTYTPAQIVSILKSMGCTSYRVGCSSDPSQIAAVAKLAAAFQSAGMTLLVLINQGMNDNNGNLLSSEGVAYNQAYSVGSAVANALKQYGVTMYECGNELTRQSSTVVDSTQAGCKVADFNNANWPAMRGVMRGMIDGVKSVQPGAKCGINFCVADVGASDALWDGIQPDGSQGHPKVRWDITTWHNYEVYGDIFNIGIDGAGPGFDLPTYCKARYGVPFMITEWNTGPEQTQAYRANYVTTQLSNFYANRKSHNIQSVMYYVLDSGNSTYGIMINGAPLSAPYAAFTGFTASHADV
ncbi:hypothetical protein PAMC26577_05955 [Caballeronia sordidicola]|uniref:Uncharacterized protein n=2 Tax=Burkholderiales TaxID=80840 RepID=A0A242N4T7_CABSO|nr:hypothetical protein PAMC26577_05955 [Caballeronia sordidicola]